MKKNDKQNEENKEENKNDDTLLNDLDETYSKYIIGDIDFLSQSSNDDIETKMNKMINIIKQGGNIKNIPEMKTRNKNIKNEINEGKEESIKDESKEQLKHLTHRNNTSSKKIVFKNEVAKNKISSKKLKLQLLKKKEENYLGLINLQKEMRQKRIRKLENQINIQTDKNESIQKGIEISDTDSIEESEIDPNMKIENGLAFFSHFYENHMIFLKLDFFQALLIKRKKKRKKTGFRLEKQKTFTIKKNESRKSGQFNKKRKQSTFISLKDMDKLQKEFENKKKNNIFYHNNLFDLKEEDKKFDFNEISQIKEIKEFNEESARKGINQDDATFIQMERIGDIDQPVDKSQLVEYDLFYKEQFFKNDVFKYDVNNIEDREEKEINREMHKLDVKRKLIAKKKEKEVNALKGLDTEDLEVEIEELEKEYKKAKTIEKPKLDMVMNNTIGLLHKGRMLECYFAGKKEEDFPRFALESEKEIGAKEVIDFKPLRKEEQARRYFDYCICLKERRQIHKCLIYSRFWSRFFVDNWIFDFLSLAVILCNTIIILMSDPNNPKNLGNITDRYFLFFYTLEAVLKIISFTFIWAEDAYLKDYWNILDFVVIISGWVYFALELLFKNADFGPLVALRAIRILRPLRVLKKIKGLKKLATALLASIGHLGETTGILIFVFVLFAIAGRHLWQGNFMKRCMNINYGYAYSTRGSEYMCSFDSDCEELNTYGLKFVCAKGYINPDSGAISFDNILTGFVTIFIMASLEGWTNVFTYASKTFKDKIFINEIIIFIYFHFFIFFCAFYLINLFLAVTNSEFEHIKSERESLIEKKSFFQLIKAKYDLREKEKLSKKERVKKLKENNSKKSNQALTDLYHKIKEEAFHIHKKKRNIPVLYSTVKDMYIMSNDNPEELYLQQLRIEKEEDFLSKDIKRQQKQINELIKEKKEEMKKSPKDRAEEEKTLMLMKTSTAQSRTNISNNNINNNIHNNLINNINVGNTIKNNIKRTLSNYSSFKKNMNLGNESVMEEVKKYVFKINKELVKDSIDRTQKFIKEKTNNITKKIQKVGENEIDKTDWRKKLEKKGKKKVEFYQIILEEDLPYEKEIRLFNEAKKGNESKIRYQNQMNKAMKIEKEKTIKKENEGQIVDALSFMSDLSLSSFDKSYTKKNKITTKDFDNKLIDNKDDKIADISINSKQSEDILLCGKKELPGCNGELEDKVNYYKPSSILAPIIKLKNEVEIKKKLKRMQEKFNLNHFLKKERLKGTVMINLKKRDSFLKFLKYTQEPKSLQEYLFSLKKSQSLHSSSESNSNDESFEEKNSLSTDSYLSDNGNLSINDIELIPGELKDHNIMMLNPNESSNKNNLIKYNKITRMIRESIFDRTAVNTNIELTTEQQSKFLKLINNNLNKCLFPDNRKPRGRKNDNLDKSHILSDNNYEQILRTNDEYFEEFQNNDKSETKTEKGSIPIIDKRHSLLKHNDSNSNINISRFSTKKFSNIRFNKSSFDSRKNSKKISRLGLGIINESLIESEDSNFYFNIKNSRTRAFDKSTMNGSFLSNIINANNAENGNRTSAYIFKAKSIEKNIDKYPKENSKDFLVVEENKPYKDPLTVKQESIPDNLRGKKYYLNYLFNISDKDLKVKDTFKVDHWSNEILGIKPKYIKKKQLPESVEAFFVFNDKKLNLKRYKYFYHKDIEYKNDECSYLTHHLKYLPRCILEIMPLRIRNFGKFAVGKEVKLGALGNKSSFLSSNTSLNKTQTKGFNSRNGKVNDGILRNKSSLILNSSFASHFKTHEEIKYKKILFERAYKKLDELNYRTLSNFLTEEEKFFSKLIDEKRRAERIRQIEIKNNEKQNKLEVKSEILNIKIYDLKTNASRYVQWSGHDVLRNKNEDKERKKWNKLIKALEDFNVIIWSNNSAIKRWQKVRYANYILATNDYFDVVVLIVVVINSFFMALDGNMLTPETLDKMNISNYVFNAIFILEYLVKFIGLSPLVYYSDPFTYIDTFIIGLAIADYTLPSQVQGEEDLGDESVFNSSLSFMKVFRIFRILRLAKILRRLKSMRLIIVSMTKAIRNVSYIVIILIMFILIFELLAMSLLSKNVHYKSFTEGFYITYQVLTLENWDGLLYELWNMNEYSFIYFAIWIFLGNYIIFNLFTSVLLQAFGEDEEDFDLSEDEIIENMYSLPDYLYNLKKAEQDHTKIVSNQKRKTTLVKELFKADLNEATNPKFDSTSYSGTSKDFNKTQIENSEKISKSNNKSAIEESEEKNAEVINDENSLERFTDRYYSEIEKSMIKWENINKIFRKNDCENSIYLLSQTNRFRIFCMKLINNKWFEKFIFLMIIFSTARLILDTFLSGYLFSLIFDFVDTFLNIIFLLEAIIKICALGFALDEGSYLRDHWNKIDIIIVICSLLDYQILFEKYVFKKADFSSSDFLKVLRLLRTIRPLRLISHNEKLKLILTSLFDSVLPIFNALFIVVIIYFIFSIIGISLFYENYHTCYILRENNIFGLAIASFEEHLVEYKVPNDMGAISAFCGHNYNGIMDTGPAFKFSNIGTALITSYVLSTQEGWPDIMNSYRIYDDSYGIFFIIYNLVVAYFFLNLFTGIMFRYFNEAYSREQRLAPNDKKAPKYLDFLTQILNSNSHYVTWLRPNKGSIKYYLREFADSNLLNNTIMACIFLNFLAMIINYEGCTSTYELVLNIANYFFTGVFVVECIIKILAYGPEGYFHTKWNRFDFLVVVVSILDIIFGNVLKVNYKFLQTFQVVRILKVTRILRIFRLIKIIKGLDKVLETLSWSLSALANVLILMIILYGIFAVLGCYFYDDLYYIDYKDDLFYINEYYNLDNFYYAFLLTFRCTTGENWNNIMMELAFINPEKFSPTYAYVYMIVGNFVNAIIMLNLFLMVTLQQYDEFTNKNYNPIEKYEKFLDEFNNSWNKFSTYEDKGFRIKKGLIINFFMDYNWKKLNFPEEGKLDYIKKYITDLKLKSDDDNYIYYHDVICKIIIEQLGSQVDRTNPQNALILKKEKKLQEKIKKKIENYIGKKNKKEKGKKTITITYNPLTSHLYFKTSYLYIKTFINYYKENAEFLHQLEGQQEEQMYNSQIREDINEGNSISNIALGLKK